MDNLGDFLPAADEWILTLTAVGLDDVDTCNEYNLTNTRQEVPCKQITAMKTTISDLPQHGTNLHPRQSPAVEE